MVYGEQRVFFNPFFAVEEREDLGLRVFFRRVFGIFIGMLGFTLCLTCLYLAMRGVMKLGGFVASGGPYHIAHPAPAWVWLFPATFMSSVVFIFLHQINARRIGGLNLLILIWPVVFVTLAENFLEFGFAPAGGQPNIAWAWVFCGVMFIVMGGIPFLVIIRNAIKILRGQAQPIGSSPLPWLRRGYEQKPQNTVSHKSVLAALIIANIAAVILGIFLGSQLFHYLSTPG
jgi:hypothetical protein